MAELLSKPTAPRIMKELNSERIITRLERLIEDGKHLLMTLAPSTTARRSERQGDEYVDQYLHLKFFTSALYFIDSTVGRDSEFYRQFDRLSAGVAAAPIKLKIAVLEALQAELQDIWYWTAQGLARAEVFSNTLEEAEHLLDRGFKIPAAVLAGCVLEQHLRSLSLRNGLDSTASPGKINDALKAAGVYNKNDGKEVAIYQGIRNSAAHGKDDEFSGEQVKLMLQGVAAFVARNPI